MKKFYILLMLAITLTISVTSYAEPKNKPIKLFCGNHQLIIGTTTHAEIIQNCGSPYREREKKYYHKLTYYKPSGELELKLDKHNKLLDIEYDTTHD